MRPSHQSTPLTRTAVRDYGLALLAVAVAITLTRLTWPLFGGTPFVPLFAAVVITTHWGTGLAGLVAILLAVSGAPMAFPPEGPSPWEPRTLAIFTLVTLVSNRVVAARNRAEAALRASESQLRAAAVDLEASEQKLRQAQKMEAVGRLAAGVAHNFNNLLTVTMGYAELLLARHGDQEQDREDLGEIHKAARRGAVLTRQLLAFGRTYDPTLVRVDLNRAVASLRHMLMGVIREDIQLTIDVAPEPAAILIDRHDLEQVVLNLVLNARDALPAGGRIRVEVARESIDATSAPQDWAAAPGDYARVRVRDDGIGMTPEVEAHLFEPFFTTKDVGEGTGLGLAFVAGIARHARGFVRIDTAPAQGTTVSVYFPRAIEAVTEPAAEPSAAPEDRETRAATILLVEDEEAVRNLTAVMLRRAGYSVLSASTPGEACALFERHVEDIDVLVTDVVMPEMRGPALAERLTAERPDLLVLFVSGYSDAIPASATASFLAKPFPPSRLITAVGELLGARANA